MFCMFCVCHVDLFTYLTKLAVSAIEPDTASTEFPDVLVIDCEGFNSKAGEVLALIQVKGNRSSAEVVLDILK